MLTDSGVARCYNLFIMEVFDSVAGYIAKHELLKKGERVVVGVSGGADSLCLLDCLTRWGAKPVVAHLDHQLRPESGADAAYVRQVADNYGQPFELHQASLSSNDSGSLEERARLERYTFLADVADKHGIETLAVGHTYDDQIETILMHFLRGAGPSGLRGMLPETAMDDWVGIPGSQSLKIIRPLLNIRHERALAYCAQAELEPRFDRTNLDQTFFRNRIRHQLLPLLEEYNPRIRPVLYRLGEIMRAEVELARDQIDHWWGEVVTDLLDGGLVLRGKPYSKLQLSIQRGLARRAVHALRPELRDVGFDHVEQIVQFILDPSRTASKSVIGDLMLCDYGEDVVLAFSGSLPPVPDYPQLIGDLILDCPSSGVVELAYGWALSIAEQESSEEIGLFDKGGDGWDVYIDHKCSSAPLVIRGRQPGDRIQPLGMQGSVKVSDLMINQKIPRLARQYWPLLVSGDDVLWVPGLHFAHAYRITESTGKVLHLSVRAP